MSRRTTRRPRRQTPRRAQRRAYHNPKALPLQKIISGGQTGADQGGLGAGHALGLATGGWVPKGWRTEEGSEQELLQSLGLKQHSSSQWPPRTKANVADADGTFIFGNAASAGCDLTIRTVAVGPEAKRGSIPKADLRALRGAVEVAAGRPALFVVPWKSGAPLPKDLFQPFCQWLLDNDIQVLNVAGNRESSQDGIYTATHDFIVSAVEMCQGATRKSGRKDSKPRKSRKKVKQGTSSRHPDALAECGPKPQLYILPITNVLLDQYLQASIVWLANDPAVKAAIEGETKGSGGERLGRTFEALREKYALDGAGMSHKGRARDDRDYSPTQHDFRNRHTRALLQLRSKNWVKPGTDKEKTEKRLRFDWPRLQADQLPVPLPDLLSREGAPVLPPDFGIYSTLLGKIGSLESRRSAFGYNRTEPTHGAGSLQSLAVHYFASRGAHKSLYPTFFVAPKKLNGVPVALVIGGSEDDVEGMSIHPQETQMIGGSPRPKYYDQLPVLEAALFAEGKASNDICFLLPQPVSVGGAKPVEVTKQLDYQKYMKGVTQYLHLRSSPEGLFQHLPKVAGADLDLAEERLEDIQAAGGLELRTRQWPVGGEGRGKEPWQAFFGDLPPVRQWASLYVKAVGEAFGRGETRKSLSDRLDLGTATYADYREKALESDLDSYDKDYRREKSTFTGVIKTYKPRTQPLQLQDLIAASMASTHFIPNVLRGSQGEGLWMPARIIIEKRGVKTKTNLAPPVMAAYWKAQKDSKARKKLYPYVVASVGLFHAPTIKDNLPTLGPDRPKVSASDVDSLLAKVTIPLGGGWFVGMLPAQSVSFGDDGLPEDATPFDFFYYYDTRRTLKVAQNLLRVEVHRPEDRDPVLRVVRGGIAPWDSQNAPYLFDELPLTEEVMKREDRLSGNKTEPPEGYSKSYVTRLVSPLNDAEGYGMAVKREFAARRKSRAERGGENALLTGRAERGGAGRRGKRGALGDVIEGAGRVNKGFYALAQKREAFRPQEDVAAPKVEDRRVLYDIIEQNWPQIRQALLEKWKEEGVEITDGLRNLQPPTQWVKEEGSVWHQIEMQTLEVLEGMIGEQGNLDIMVSSGLFDYHEKRGGGSRSARISPLHEYGPEAQGVLRTMHYDDLASDNPRGRRPRKSRKPRKSRYNPVEGDDIAKLDAWVADATSEHKADTITSFRKPTDVEEFVESVKEFFPHGTPQTRPSTQSLHPRRRFDTLREIDLVGRFAQAESDPDADALLDEFLGAGDLDVLSEGIPGRDDYPATKLRKYVADQADLSAVEARELAKIRWESKRRGGIITASGALCKEYRGASRLKGYRPPMGDGCGPMAARTCWIWVGPRTSQGAPARVMSFRNGAHIDCDMIVTPSRSLGFIIAKAIEGMILWLAEKPQRMKPDRLKAIYFGYVGSKGYRAIWRPGWPLDPHALLEEAYKSPAIAVPWDAETDKEEYASAVNIALERRGYRSAPPREIIRSVAVTEVEVETPKPKRARKPRTKKPSAKKPSAEETVAPEVPEVPAEGQRKKADWEFGPG